MPAAPAVAQRAVEKAAPALMQQAAEQAVELTRPTFAKAAGELQRLNRDLVNQALGNATRDHCSTDAMH